MTKNTAYFEGSINAKSKKFKRLNLLKPSRAILGLFLLTVLFIISSFFYWNFETSANGTSRPHSVAWVASMSGLSLMSSVLSSRENEGLGFVDEEDGDSCDIFDGKWVWDQRYPLYKSPDCAFLDEGFRCSENGRANNFYTKWRWQPKDCDLPRFEVST
ncbi:Trichome birefringence-like family [Parasponia andersonii]|uniref:Trichome birefringence-like family n=1 Tax=Parasponia andersonii TaxID=3476 RepID=A0A2P5CXQ0_PARAD|nr:Trichome birefringence-like family [Parasponia andersonii]